MRKLFIVFLFLVNNIYSQSDRYIELDLVQCLEIALENNLQLKRSEINQEIQKVIFYQNIQLFLYIHHFFFERKISEICDPVQYVSIGWS